MVVQNFWHRLKVITGCLWSSQYVVGPLFRSHSQKNKHDCFAIVLFHLVTARKHTIYGTICATPTQGLPSASLPDSRLQYLLFQSCFRFSPLMLQTLREGIRSDSRQSNSFSTGSKSTLPSLTHPSQYSCPYFFLYPSFSAPARLQLLFRARTPTASSLYCRTEDV